MDREHIWDAAEAVFDSNRLSNGVITPELPHFNGSFLWDTAIIARARALTWTHDAAHLINRHLAGQHPSGLLPNEVIFQTPTFEQATFLKYKQMSPNVYGSTITQPPILSTAVRHVAVQIAKEERVTFLKSVFPQLKQFAEWLFAARSDEDDKLIIAVHPYETGSDNSPVWDESLENAWGSNRLSRSEKLAMRIGRPILNHFRQASNEFDGTDVSERSQHDEILVGLLQLRAVHKNGNVSERIRNDSRAALIKDVGYNALAAYGFEDLIWIENTINSDNPLFEISESLYGNIQNHRKSIEQFMWDDESNTYVSIDARTNQRLCTATAGTLLPLLITNNPQRSQSIVDRITDRNHFWTPMPIPSVSMSSDHFQPKNYWRGPSWPFMRLFVFDALIEHGHADIAKDIARTVLENNDVLQFAEYNHPITGQALGKKQFSPAAAEAQIYIRALNRIEG